MPKRILFLLLFVLAILAILFVFSSQQKSTSKSQPTKPAEVKKAQPEKKTLADAKIAGTVAYWDGKDALNRLANVISSLDSFSPTLYRIEPDGSLGKLNLENRKAFLDLARESKIPITPNVGDDFDSQRVSLLLSNQVVQEKFLEDLVDEAKKEGLAGWVVDIESLKAGDEEAFTNFVVKAAQILHQNGLKLKVVVFAKTGQDEYPPAQAENYQTLGATADEIWLMLFGYHNEDTQPGGQAPLAWLREVLDYTTKLVPKEKIVVVLSTHGYDWAGGTAEILDYPQVEQRIQKNSASLSFDQDSSSAIANYSENGVKHVIWFEDAQTINQKLQIVLDEFEIDKFALWRIGAEDPKIWEGLKK